MWSQTSSGTGSETRLVERLRGVRGEGAATSGPGRSAVTSPVTSHAGDTAREPSASPVLQAAGQWNGTTQDQARRRPGLPPIGHHREGEGRGPEDAESSGSPTSTHAHEQVAVQSTVKTAVATTVPRWPNPGQRRA